MGIYDPLYPTHRMSKLVGLSLLQQSVPSITQKSDHIKYERGTSAFAARRPLFFTMMHAGQFSGE
jgi:hypothetical protein